MKIYLAHPFDSREYVRKWEKLHPNIFINPFYHPLSFDKFNEGDISNDKYFKKLKYKLLVETDLQLIQQCDSILAVIDGNKSYGTIMEICYAFRLFKPVYIICTNGMEEHPWLKYHSRKIFRSFEEFEEELNNGRI